YSGFCVGSHGAKRGLGLGFRKGCVTRLAAPALDAPFAEVSKLFAGFVLTVRAGHGFSPLDFCAELSHNEFGSRSWFAPRSGLAPQPVSAGSGALNVSYGLGWRFNRDFHGVTVSECDLDADYHADCVLPESPVDAGLSPL